MSAVITRSPGESSRTMWLSATSMPRGICSARMYGEGGVRSALFATSVICSLVRSAARYRMSLITAGQASASTQMCMGRYGNIKKEAVLRRLQVLLEPPPQGGGEGDGSGET